MSAGNGGGRNFILSAGSSNHNRTTDSDFLSFVAEVGSDKWKHQVEEIRTTYATVAQQARDDGLTPEEVTTLAKDAIASLKRKLPAITPSGTFHKRANNALKQHNDIVHVDLDQLGDDLGKWRALIEADPHTLYAPISPSGTGLKVFYICDASRPHLESYLAAERHVLEKFGLVSDPSCKEPARLCFVTWDPAAKLNLDAVPLPYPPPAELPPAPDPQSEAIPEAQASQIRRRSVAGHVSALDAYNASDDFMTVLRADGWTTKGDNLKSWFRPNKTSEPSATWDTQPEHPRKFHNFSTSVPNLPIGNHSPVAIYARLRCGGNFDQAEEELYWANYGTRNPNRLTKAQQQALDEATEATLPSNGSDDAHNGEVDPEQMARLTDAYNKRRLAESPLAEPPPSDKPEDAVTAIAKDVAEQKNNPAPSKSGKQFSVWQPAQFRAYNPPPNLNILGAGQLRRRQLATLIGPPGVGKSRLSLWIGVCHICGRTVVPGIEPQNFPAKWLFFGNENDPLRQKTDLDNFYRHLTSPEQLACDTHLFLHVMDQPDDGIITLADPEAWAKLVATLKAILPDVIVFDPWGNMIEGNENDNEEVRKTLKLLLRAVAIAAPDAAILVIHHARTGKNVAIEAGNNYSGGNLSRGSKALVSSARCELALWPGDSEDSSKLVLTCEKINNAKKFEPLGLLFDNGIYIPDHNFALDAWKDDISGIRGNGKTLTIDDLVQAVRSGIHKKSDLVRHCEDDFSVDRSTVTRRLKDAIEKGWLAATHPIGSYTLGPKFNPPSSPKTPPSEDFHWPEEP